MARKFILTIRSARSRRRKHTKPIKSLSPISSLIIGILFGAIAGWVISEHFHRVTTKEYRILLLKNALFEAKVNLNNKIYVDYIDTLSSLTAGHRFEYLQDLSFKELYKNIQLFEIDDPKENVRFKELVLRCKHEIETFNDGVRVRNDWIVRDPKTTKKFNPYIYEDYYESVRPTLEEFINYGSINESLLTS